MPLYEFKCDKCDFITEVILPVFQIGFDPVIKHKCGERMQRVYSPSQIKVLGYSAENNYGLKK